MIILKSHQEIEKIRQACLIAADVLQGVRDLVRPGVTTMELDEFAERLIRQAGARPAFKGYRGYPRTICTSVNDQIVHGIPSRGVTLKDGDIISIDVGTILDGYFGDAAVTIPVGQVAADADSLIRTTEESLLRGIGAAEVGNRLYDISYAIQSCAEAKGFSVVRDFVGHGIGRDLHEDPQVPNFGARGQGPRLRAGMVLAIEPMINAGGSATVVREDGWTAVTADGSLSAHFEHTVAITDAGPQILTKR